MFSELVTACRLAGAPTSFSPSLVMATTEGVVLFPYAFSMTLGLPLSMSATQELVVPRSMPMMGPFPAEAKGWSNRLVQTLSMIWISLLIELKFNMSTMVAVLSTP